MSWKARGDGDKCKAVVFSCTMNSGFITEISVGCIKNFGLLTK